MSIVIQDLNKPTVTVNSTPIPEREVKTSDLVYTVANPDSYVFVGPVTVTLTSSYGDAKITYTTDGRRPTRHSSLYSAPFVLYENTSGCDNTVLKVRVWRAD